MSKKQLVSSQCAAKLIPIPTKWQIAVFYITIYAMSLTHTCATQTTQLVTNDKK